MAEKKQSKVKLLITLVVIVAVVGVLWKLGIFKHINIKNLQNLKGWINGFGALGPIIYIFLYIAACLFFLPGLPVALLAGFAFGPVWGTVYASIGSTLGACAAFLVARYAARSMVEGWAGNNPAFKKIDEGVKNQGWRMLMITRLVPAFPFNVQNYAYGLTSIGFLTYALVSWVCMLPGTIAFTVSAGAIAAGESMGTTFIYLGIGAIFFVLLSLIPGWMKKRNKDIEL